MKLSFRKRNWDRLLTEIEDQKIIPVIGPELLVIELDGRPVNFYHYLAGKLAERLNLNQTILSDKFSLNDVAVAFIAEHGDPADIYFEIREIIKNRSWPVPPPLLQLAEIRPFNLFLSTSFDPFMEEALDAVRFNGADQTISLVYSNRGRKTDLPPDLGTDCFVFHLFGKVSAAPDYAVTDDDLLLFNHFLQSEDQQPVNLFDRLKSNYLLTLGCNFPDWLARFFFCAAKGEFLFSDMGMRGVVADQRVLNDDNLNEFLGRRKTLFYDRGNAVDFVSELHRRWCEKFGNIGEP